MIDEQEPIKNIFSSVVNKPQKVTDVYLFHPLTNALVDIPYVETLRATKPDDTVKIHFNSVDSSLDAFITFFNHLILTEGDTQAYIHRTASYISLLALCCKEILVLPMASFTLSLPIKIGFGSTDKESSIIEEAINIVCPRVLSNEEIKELKEGKTFTFNAKELDARLEKYGNPKKHKKKTNVRRS